MKITKQQRKNVEIFLKRWAEVPPKNVISSLHTFRGEEQPETAPHTCDTLACAGGWIPAMPEFAAMGVKVGWNGQPTMSSCADYRDVANELFGNADIFEMRGSIFVGFDEEKYMSHTDHDIVRFRFESLLKGSA